MAQTGLQFTPEGAGVLDEELAVVAFTHTEQLSHPFTLEVTPVA
ncbi:hypothetical protein [Aidingimonas halophila]|uniref:Uncharacterized protein n=1 Tax=Aidingimonas halophila TaxID=574349 RepID=A0A1H2S4T1_9GAMM|nr:hypothetical protein [Aidingimonas halophila]GHC18240.1 hypothetical protein GCM10008094_05020 [Aidingimonas halophila]SDW26623.1 hypothetical protein SAMN05443545_101473 [Aidingimonas halophila]